MHDFQFYVGTETLQVGQCQIITELNQVPKCIQFFSGAKMYSIFSLLTVAWRKYSEKLRPAGLPFNKIKKKTPKPSCLLLRKVKARVETNYFLSATAKILILEMKISAVSLTVYSTCSPV